jgi:hypothetical protein
LLLELGPESSLLFPEDVFASEDELEDVVEEAEDDVDVLEELFEDDEDENELKLGTLFRFSGGCLRFEWLLTDELESAGLTLWAKRKRFSWTSGCLSKMWRRATWICCSWTH